jgi:hypothetical protein
MPDRSTFLAFSTVASQNLKKTFQTVPSKIDKNAPFGIIINRLFDVRCGFLLIELLRDCNKLHNILGF